MIRLRKIIFCLLLMTTGILTVWPDSLMVSTRIQASWDNVEPDERMRVTGIESGVMETLFDNGFVFFSMYNPPDEKGQHQPLELLQSISAKSGADYLLELLSDESGVTWRLHSLGGQATVKEAYADISLVAKSIDHGRRWFALGQILGQQLADSILSH